MGLLYNLVDYNYPSSKSESKLFNWPSLFVIVYISFWWPINLSELSNVIIPTLIFGVFSLNLFNSWVNAYFTPLIFNPLIEPLISTAIITEYSWEWSAYSVGSLIVSSGFAFCSASFKI